MFNTTRRGGERASASIELSKSACGIHGTASPKTVGKSQRHGCVGLTNWDVNALSALVQPGKTVVEFQD